MNRLGELAGKLIAIALCFLTIAGALAIFKLSFIVFRWVLMGVWG